MCFVTYYNSAINNKKVHNRPKVQCSFMSLLARLTDNK